MWLRFTWIPDKRCALSGMTTVELRPGKPDQPIA